MNDPLIGRPSNPQSLDERDALQELYRQQRDALRRGDMIALERVREDLDAIAGKAPAGSSRASDLPDPRFK